MGARGQGGHVGMRAWGVGHGLPIWAWGHGTWRGTAEQTKENRRGPSHTRDTNK